mgnify:CR=1 FL=1
MKNKFLDYFSIEFIKFLVVSGFAAAVNFTARVIVNFFTSYAVAIIIAFIFGLTTAFILNKIWVFSKGGKNMKREFIKFTIINLLALPQTLIISLLLALYLFPAIGYTYHPKEVAHLIGIGFPVFTSYLGHKYFSFKSNL